ncbi:MAG: META domain-containing protein [Planctomycetaceae bacterium]|nr:META domain-containing protein [Planctomycetaceae bacterium]
MKLVVVGVRWVGAVWSCAGWYAGSILLGVSLCGHSSACCLQEGGNTPQESVAPQDTGKPQDTGAPQEGPSAPEGVKMSADELKQLAWLVGDWKTGSDSKIAANVSARWTADGHFLLLDYTVNPPEFPTITASDRIAWDPVGKSFRSWTFRGDGGFGQANWVARENGWMIRYGGTHSDGRQFSSTLLLERGANGELKLSAIERWIGDEQFPDLVLEMRQAGAPITAEISIEDKTWELYRLESGPIRLAKRPTLRFSNQEVQAFGGVNQMGGTYQKKGNELRFRDFLSTLIGGTAAESEVEQEFAAMLERVTHYSIEEGELILRNGENPIGWFQERQSTKSNFDDVRGVTWELIELKGVVVELEPRPTLRFVDGNVEGNGGVNQMGGTFNQTEDTLTFGPLRSTRRGGPPEAMQLEANFGRALSTVDRFALEDDNLCLSSGNEVVAKFRRQE